MTPVELVAAATAVAGLAAAALIAAAHRHHTRRCGAAAVDPGEVTSQVRHLETRLVRVVRQCDDMADPAGRLELAGRRLA
jgi:hypothetical protein